MDTESDTPALPGIRQREQSEPQGRAFAETLLDALELGLLVLNSALRVEAANRAFYQTFQTTERNTCGKHVFELGDGGWDGPELRGLLETVLSTEFQQASPQDESPASAEVTHVFTDGKRILSLSAQRLEPGSRILLSVEDVTERRRAERVERRQSEQLYRALAANLPGGAAFVVDHALRYRLAAGEALAGADMTPLDLEGRSIHEVFETALARVYEPLYRQALGGEAFRLEHSAHGRHYVSHGTPLRNEAGAVYAALAVSYDITERKRAEDQLQELNDTLEARVQTRTQEVRSLASQLTLVENRERSRLAQTLHDELQQQLHALQFPLSHLQKTVQDERSRAHIDQAYAVLKDAIHITRTVTSELSPPVLRGEGLTAALQWLAANMHKRFGLRVNVQVDSVPEVSGEALQTLLFTLVRECLFNVTKHAGVAAAEVRVGVVADRLELRVSDRGTGFDLDSLQGGSGLGLQNADRRLRLFGGEVTVDSALGEGTRVTLAVPLTSLQS